MEGYEARINPRRSIREAFADPLKAYERTAVKDRGQRLRLRAIIEQEEVVFGQGKGLPIFNGRRVPTKPYWYMYSYPNVWLNQLNGNQHPRLSAEPRSTGQVAKGGHAVATAPPRHFDAENPAAKGCTIQPERKLTDVGS
jgi:hypothetical protein